MATSKGEEDYPERFFYKKPFVLVNLSYGFWWAAWHQFIALPVDAGIISLIMFALAIGWVGLGKTLGWDMSQSTPLDLGMAVSAAVAGIVYFWKLRSRVVAPFAHFINGCLGLKPKISS